VRILVVSATAAEIAPFVARLRAVASRDRLSRYAHAGRDVDVLVTGVGMVPTASWCARVLAERQYDLALNVGVCGSFDPAIEPGQVVHVVSDRLSEVGAEDDETFLTLAELKLAADDEFPFRGGRIVNAAPPANGALRALRAVNGITVNTVHGNARSIAAIVARFAPDVESMEGAAFMYACLMAGIPFAQVRAVSNIVEKRNRAAWKLDEAIARLADAVLAVVEQA